MFTTKHISRISHRASASTLSGRQGKQTANANQDLANKATKEDTREKTILEHDEELKQKMSGLSGDGGEAGIEYEDGKPVAMKRSVKNNLFRYI